MSRKHLPFTPFEKTTTGRGFYGLVGITAIFFGVSTMGTAPLLSQLPRRQCLCSGRNRHRDHRTNDLFSKSANPNTKL